MSPTLKTFSAMSPPLGHTHIPYSSFSTVKMSYADALRGWRTVTAFDGAGDTCSRGGQVCDSVSEICRNRGDSSVFRLSPSVFSNCLRRTLICFRRPTAGVKGVCPPSRRLSVLASNLGTCSPNQLLPGAAGLYRKERLAKHRGGQANVF